MSKKYQWSQNPNYNFKNGQVTISLEDYERLMHYAALSADREESKQDQLNSLATKVNAATHEEHSGTIIPPTITQFSESPGQAVDALARVSSTSVIIQDAAGVTLGANPLKFLAVRLGKFKSASLLFATKCMPRSSAAKEFHEACDGVENVLVIIKSGQYIAGGYTEVPFESRSKDFFKQNPKLTTFVWSANRQKVYPLQRKEYAALNCNKEMGPTFGAVGLGIQDDYATSDNFDSLHLSYSSYNCPGVVEGELFGSEKFAVDEYEVYQLTS